MNSIHRTLTETISSEMIMAETHLTLWKQEHDKTKRVFREIICGPLRKYNVNEVRKLYYTLIEQFIRIFFLKRVLSGLESFQDYLSENVHFHIRNVSSEEKFQYLLLKTIVHPKDESFNDWPRFKIKL